MELIHISGQNLSIGQSLQEYARDRLNSIVNKYFDHAPSANIKFSKERGFFVCDVIVNDGTGRHTVIKARSSSDDIYSSFDSAIDKIAKQLRKYKSKLKDRGDRVKLSELYPETIKYVIQTASSKEDHLENEVDVNNPLIIAEKPSGILKLSVGTAVMYMDLQDLPALMFENVNTGRINVVYYRKDGNISWIDSK